MGITDIEQYLGLTVRINYESKGELHSRTGILTAVSIRRAALLLFVDDCDPDEEISIKIKDIKRIYKLKALDE